jgi:2-C-methyl-D-erythritol 4-phosphate cytidylyltransferase
VPREKLWAAQTPQTFKYDLIMRAYRAAREKEVQVTDEAAAVELLGEPVHIVESHQTNLKVTTPADVEVARVLLPTKVVVDKGTVPTGTFYFGKSIEERYR